MYSNGMKVYDANQTNFIRPNIIGNAVRDNEVDRKRNYSDMVSGKAGLVLTPLNGLSISANLGLMNENSRYIRYLESMLIQGLVDAKIDFVRNGINHVPGNLSLSFKGYEGEMLLHRLDLLGICISTGSACDSVNTQVSHVLKAIRLDKEYAEGTIRISLGKNNTESEVQEILNAIIKIIKSKNIQ
jgi:cysteine sulfinate desulfinase/cysteine desulfurase-like protein